MVHFCLFHDGLSTFRFKCIFVHRLGNVLYFYWIDVTSYSMLYINLCCVCRLW